MLKINLNMDNGNEIEDISAVGSIDEIASDIVYVICKIEKGAPETQLRKNVRKMLDSPNVNKLFEGWKDR